MRLIQANEIGVWLVDFTHFHAPTLLSDQLNTWELNRFEAMRQPLMRRNFLASHLALQKIVQVHLNNSEPIDWQYSLNGKPYIPGSKLKFSLTHSGDIALVGLAYEIDIGIDVEKCRKLKKDKILKKYFSERDIFSDMDFFDLWVRREAFAKASGVGLAKTNKQLCFNNDYFEVDSVQWCIKKLPIEPLPVAGAYKAAIAFAADPATVVLKIEDYYGV